MASHNLVPLAARYEDRMVSFLQDLVRIRSVNGTDSEAEVVARILAEADTLGLAGRSAARETSHPNALVGWGDGTRRFAILAHTDTVSEGEPAVWHFDPFSGEVADGKLYGRGAADNKAGIAVGLYTLALLRDHSLLDPEQAQVWMAAVSDEESGAVSPYGVRYLLDEGQLQADGAIYAYTSDIVCVGHRGAIRLQIQAAGQAIHSGAPEWSRGEGGINAVTGLAEALLALEQLTIAAPSHPAFEGIGCTITPGTLFQGGRFMSMVPDRAEAMVDIRTMPGQSHPLVLSAIDEVLRAVMRRRSGLVLSYTLHSQFPGAAIPVDHPLAVIAARHAQEITGRSYPIKGAGPGNEGYMLIQAGIPTLPGFGPTGGNAHAPNEWVEIASLKQTMAIFAATICEYLSLANGSAA